MTTDYTAPTGAPCWIDLSTTDPERARSFYCDLFGWTAEDPNTEFGGYFNFNLAGARVAGGMETQQEQGGVPNVWSIYLSVPDAQATADAAVARGGQVLVPPMPVGDLGTMGYLTDAGGAAVGFWQPGMHKGFGTIAENGAPSWWELHTRDFGRTISFYENVFGWTTKAESDTDEFRYSMMVNPGGEGWLAGVMDASAFLPEGVPAHWSVYFGCEDTDKAVARVQELGGALVQPAEDSPYGRLATVADPMGAIFKLVHMDMPEA